jgi:excisionase family DNA binding protein
MDKQLENIRLLTLSEAASLLQVSTRTLQRMIRNGGLPAFKVGGQWRVRETQLRQWVEDRENSAIETEKESDSQSPAIKDEQGENGEEGLRSWEPKS